VVLGVSVKRGRAGAVRSFSPVVRAQLRQNQYLKLHSGSTGRASLNYGRSSQREDDVGMNPTTLLTPLCDVVAH
jgi:hypothetical protein